MSETASDTRPLLAQIEQMREQALAAFDGAPTTDDLEHARVQHVGRSAPLTQLLRGLRDMPPDVRGKVGAAGNIARRDIEQRLQQRKDQLHRAELDARLRDERVDVTLPGVPMPAGSLHLLTQTRRMIEDVFVGMGYRIADGPEIESAYYNFTALNTPEGHPARSPSDTFYFDDDTLLRTQTSPVQVRVMESQPPPVYVISPGRVYRRDRIDATHGSMFHQIEALAVDRGLTLAHLKGTIEVLCRHVFGADRQIRLRTHFFPFTEPSVEADVSCFRCEGPGDTTCRICRGEGWIELMGAGMVDPNVFAHVVGYDAPGLRGFALGLGVERVAMLRHGVPDLRLFVQNDPRFLAQFPTLPQGSAAAPATGDASGGHS